MPLKIVIPARVILDQKDGILRLDHPLTCSRCGRRPAELNETHKLKLRAGLKKIPLPGKRYKMEINYQLKIRICARCYQMDYLQAPEALGSDPIVLGRLSQMQNILRNIGGITAAMGLLLLTAFVPATPALLPIKAHWWIPLSAGVGLVLLSLASQVSAQTKLRHQMESTGEFDASLLRAEVRTPLFAMPEDIDQVALEVRLVNEEWAKESAAFYHYHIEEFEK